MSKAIFVLFLMLVAGCKQEHAPDLSCRVIHRPAKGCPEGYSQEKMPRFTEKDGSHQYACISYDVSKDPCSDFLMPGESETFRLFSSETTR